MLGDGHLNPCKWLGNSSLDPCAEVGCWRCWWTFSCKLVLPAAEFAAFQLGCGRNWGLMGKHHPRSWEVSPAHLLQTLLFPQRGCRTCLSRGFSLSFKFSSSYFLTKKSPLYQQKFTGFTGEKCRFALMCSKKDAEKWEKNLVFAFFPSLCKLLNTSFLKGPISAETKWWWWWWWWKPYKTL